MDFLLVSESLQKQKQAQSQFDFSPDSLKLFSQQLEKALKIENLPPMTSGFLYALQMGTPLWKDILDGRKLDFTLNFQNDRLTTAQISAHLAACKELNKIPGLKVENINISGGQVVKISFNLSEKGKKDLEIILKQNKNPIEHYSTPLYSGFTTSAPDGTTLVSSQSPAIVPMSAPEKEISKPKTPIMKYDGIKPVESGEITSGNRKPQVKGHQVEGGFVTVPAISTSTYDRFIAYADGRVLRANPGSAGGKMDEWAVDAIDILLPMKSFVSLLSKAEYNMRNPDNQQPIEFSDVAAFALELGCTFFAAKLISKSAKIAQLGNKLLANKEFWDSSLSALNKSGLTAPQIRVGITRAVEDMLLKPAKYAGKSADEAARIFAKDASNFGAKLKVKPVSPKPISSSVEKLTQRADKFYDSTGKLVSEQFVRASKLSYAGDALRMGMHAFAVGYTGFFAIRAIELATSKELPSWVFEDKNLAGANLTESQIRDITSSNLKREFAIFWAGWGVANKISQLAPKIVSLYSKAWESAPQGATKVAGVLSAGWREIQGSAPQAEYISAISNSIYQMSQTITKPQFAQILSGGLQGGAILGLFGEDITDLTTLFGEEYKIKLPYPGAIPSVRNMGTISANEKIVESHIENKYLPIANVSELPVKPDAKEIILNNVTLMSDSYSEQTMLEALRYNLLLIDFENPKAMARVTSELTHRQSYTGSLRDAEESFTNSYLSFYKVSSNLGMLPDENGVYLYSRFQSLLSANYDKTELSGLLGRYSNLTPLDFWLDVEAFAIHILSSGPQAVFAGKSELEENWTVSINSGRSEGEKLTKAIEQTLKYLLWGYITREFYEFQNTKGSDTGRDNGSFRQ